MATEMTHENGGRRHGSYREALETRLRDFGVDVAEGVAGSCEDGERELQQLIDDIIEPFRLFAATVNRTAVDHLGSLDYGLATFAQDMLKSLEG